MKLNKLKQFPLSAESHQSPAESLDIFFAFVELGLFSYMYLLLPKRNADKILNRIKNKLPDFLMTVLE